jgi:hypothetical protein
MLSFVLWLASWKRLEASWTQVMLGSYGPPVSSLQSLFIATRSYASHAQPDRRASKTPKGLLPEGPLFLEQRIIQYCVMGHANDIHKVIVSATVLTCEL